MTNTLDQETDNLRLLLDSAAQALSDLKLGVRAEVRLTRDSTLAFEKSRNKWMFMVSDATGSHRLSSMSRQVRLLAATKLQDLHEALVAEHDKQLLEVRRAVDQVTEFLRTFDKSAG